MADVPETGVDRPYASGPTNCRFESCPSHQPNAAAVERIRAYLDAMQVYFHGENTIIHTVTTPTDSTMRRLTLADLREAFDGFSEGNKWVAVAERQPDQGDNVIVFDPDYGGVQAARVFVIAGQVQFYEHGPEGDRLYHVTHWMPLPEAP